MALIAVAEKAQDIAAGFNKFLDPVPEISTEVTGLISECYAISSALRELNTAREDPRYSYDYDGVIRDVHTVRQSLDYTFTDVFRLFGGLGRPASHISNRTLYHQVWREIDDHFYRESRSSLIKRLESNRLYLQDITCILIDGQALSELRYYDLQDQTIALLEKQESRLEATFNNMSLGDAGANRQRSFERRRPPGLFTQVPEPPPAFFRGGRRPGPISPQSPPGFDQDYPWAPPAPDVPNSPTTETTFSTQSSAADSSLSHWLPAVFAQSRPTTSFRQTGEMPFEDGDLRVRLYHRSFDQRARIHCRLSRNGRSQRQTCLPLTAIRLQRHASTLKLCRVDSSGHMKELWACLRFPSYERALGMVLFYCAFLSLRSEDSGSPIGSFDDHEIHGEKSVYAGKIIDDNFEHALRVFKDRDSGGIRLQASVLRGELKRTPVWTAFITTHIQSTRWMRKAPGAPRIIHIADLQRYIFTTEYSPQLGPQGQHELRFVSSRGESSYQKRQCDSQTKATNYDYHNEHRRAHLAATSSHNGLVWDSRTTPHLELVMTTPQHGNSGPDGTRIHPLDTPSDSSKTVSIPQKDSPPTTWQRACDILFYTPKRCRYDPTNPPKFSTGLNLLFAFASAFTVANLYYNHPILHLLAGEFGISNERASLIPTLAQAGYAAGLLFLCPLGDIFPRRLYVLSLVLFTATVWLGLCLTNSFAIFCFLTFLTSLTTVTPQLMLPLVGDLAPPNRRAAALSIVASGLLLGMLLARLLSGVVTNYTSWRNIYWLSFGLQYLIFVLLWFFMPDYPSANPDGLSYFRIMWSILTIFIQHPLLIQACLVGFCTSTTFTSFWTTLTFLLSSPPYEYSTLVIGLFALIGIFSMLVTPIWCRHVTDSFIPLFSVILGLSFSLTGTIIGTYIGSFTVTGPIIQALFLDFGIQTAQVANRSAIYSILPQARNRVNTAYMICAFTGQLTGTAVGNHVYAMGGWISSGSVSVGFLSAAVGLCFLRGPREKGWIGWGGGWKVRKKGEKKGGIGEDGEREVSGEKKGDSEKD
ncbi:MAG: hypothetical protein Q9170_002473 [Blastenia crenularia]